ncbi:MAG: DUF2141 domain-containing protein [Parvularculaceae bacterium]
MLKRFGIAVLLIAAAPAALAAKDKADDAVSAEAFAFEHVSCTGAPNEIRIVVTGVKKAQGLITADLFPNDQEKFLHGRGRLAQVRFAAKAPMTQFCLDAPEAGQFAISVYHDENANKKFDKTAIGLPAERWGLSNNPKVVLAPPPVDKALFDVTADGAEVYIRLN